VYASEAWLMKAGDKRRISAFEAKCLNHIPGINHTNSVSNEDLRKVVHFSCTVTDQIRSRQLHWFGHIKRMASSQPPKNHIWRRVTRCMASWPRWHKRWYDNFNGQNLPQIFRLASERTKCLCYVQWLVRTEEAPT